MARYNNDAVKRAVQADASRVYTLICIHTDQLHDTHHRYDIKH